jgi:hypothetical protein
MFHVKHFAKPRYFDPFPRLRYNAAMRAKFDVVVIGGGHAGCEAAAEPPAWARKRRW